MKNKEKICHQCKKPYPSSLEYFVEDRSNIDGLGVICKKCREVRRIYKKEYRKKNKVNIRAYNKKYAEDHCEYIAQYRSQYYQKNKDQIILQHKEYTGRPKIIKKLANYNKDYRRKNKDQLREYEKNRYPKRKNYLRDYCKMRWDTDIEYRIISNLRSRLYLAIKHCKTKKSDHSMKLIGCSIKKLIKHLESQFDDKMTWDNYGYYGWHIDHIKPCALFDLTKPKEQRKCFNYKNLQPLWGPDNWSKNSSYKGKLYRKNK